MVECHQKDLSVSDKLGTFIPCLISYFPEMSARVSHKVATKGSVRGKKKP